MKNKEKCPRCGSASVDSASDPHFCNKCTMQYRRTPVFSVLIDEKSPFFDATRPVKPWKE